MDDTLSEERKANLIKITEAVVNADILTNMDGRMIIEILLTACQRKQNGMLEKMLTESIEKD